MPEDALAALQAAAQRRRASTGAAATTTKKRSAPPASRPAGGPGRRASAPVVSRQGSSFTTCPVCGASVPAALLESHANECLDLSQQRHESREGTGSCAPSQEQQAPQHQPQPQPPRPSALAALMATARPPPGGRPSPPPPPPPRTVPGTGAVDPSKPSALAAIMAAQREAGRVHTLFAEWRAAPAGPPPSSSSAGGAWFWHWAADKKSVAALPPSAWSGEASVSLAALAAADEDGGGGQPAAAGPAKVALRLATNAVPGDGGGAGRVPFAGGPPQYPPSHGAVGGGPAAAAAGRPPTSVSASPSVLKSALQKNVRLGRGVAAVRLALHLLRTEPGELLRRVVIIMVEDVCLHPALPLCVWAMAAHSKGFTLPRSAVTALLRVVWQLAACRVRDDPAAWAAAPRLSLDGLFAEGSSGTDAGHPTLASQLPPEARLLVRCLAVRAAYGGMACDVALLRDAAGVWAARLAGAAGFPPKLPEDGGGGGGGGGGGSAAATMPSDDPGAAWLAYLKAATVFTTPPPPPGLVDGPGVAAGPPPCVPDVPLSAIDFHVCGIADDAMLLPPIAAAAAAAAVRAGGDGAGADAAERLRRAMWVFRSSINRRARVIPLPPADVAADKGERADLLPLWRVAAGPLDAWAADFIKHRFPPG